MKISRRTPQLTRQRLADPHQDVNLTGLWTRERCLDLRQNWKIQDLGGGYATVRPIDGTRRWGDAERGCGNAYGSVDPS